MQFPQNERGWQKPLAKSTLEIFTFVEEEKNKQSRRHFRKKLVDQI